MASVENEECCFVDGDGTEGFSRREKGGDAVATDSGCELRNKPEAVFGVEITLESRVIWVRMN